MNKDWKYGILDNAVKKGSSNISLNKIQKDEGPYPVFGAKGFMKNVSFYHQERDYLALIKDGAGIGRVSKHPAKSSVLATMQYIIPKEGYDIDFIRYFLEGLDFEDYRTGSTIPHIYYKDYKNARFPLVGVNEQQQIVAILDEAFEAIDQAKANIEKNIENAKELFQSKLNDIFCQKGEGWVEKTLGEVCMKTKNIRWKDHKNKEYQYVDLSSVSRETLEVTETVIINDKNAPSRAKKIIEKGDVIFATTRPTLKRATIIDKELDGQICSTGFVVLRPNEKISADWIFFYLLTSTFMDRMESLQRGASYPAVTDSDVKDSLLSVPTSKIIESKYVSLMGQLRENTNELVIQYQEKLNSLEELKKSILQKAFVGELTNKQLITI
ncbi:restriction endonuclease subunit S [Gaetbulibacter aquiaggeris]|uniref:Restriction endonuclease subunit S n=1 Tax=Gaetbulibacter aquiaggeris TaxID=1735373 RepID=A0ABW7MQL7_9FLAO